MRTARKVGAGASVFVSVMTLTASAGSAASERIGMELVAAWCGGCHAVPAPSDLDRATWTRHVLPEMGARLGIHEFRGRRWRADPSQPAGTYPARPLLPPADWGKIYDYYRDGAPAHPRPAAAAPARTTRRFAVRLPPVRTDGEPAAVTAILVDEHRGRILVGDAAGRRVLVHDRTLGRIAAVPVDTPPVDFTVLGDGSYLVTLIGSLAPGDVPRGTVVRLAPPGPNRNDWVVTRLVRRLPRPVRTLAFDADRDGLHDLVVAGFGHARGGISLFLARPSPRRLAPHGGPCLPPARKRRDPISTMDGGPCDPVPGAGAYARVALLEEPGAVALGLHRGDLYALMAQGDERLIRIPGEEIARRVRQADEDPGASHPGPHAFRRPLAPAVTETIRRFPPQRGSSSMRVLDFDDDGAVDLLVTAGDNADFTPVFKRGHGVRLYLGDGRGGFRLALFHRLDGAYGAVAEDFDGDGDRDIAAVAWFADFARGPQEAAGFVYLENHGAGTFRAARVPGLERLGRFVVIDAGDVDADGDPDLVLGNLAYGSPGPSPPAPAVARAWAAGPRFVVLATNPGDGSRPETQEVRESLQALPSGAPPSGSIDEAR